MITTIDQESIGRIVFLGQGAFDATLGQTSIGAMTVFSSSSLVTVAIKTSIGVGILGLVSVMSSSFNQSSPPVIAIRGGLSEQSFTHDLSSVSTLVASGVGETQAIFTYSNVGSATFAGSGSADLNFTSSTFLERLYEGVDTQTNPETFTVITPQSSLGTWANITPPSGDWTILER